MKKIAILLIVLMSINSAFSQKNNPKPALAKEDYLQKSKKQKTVAWILFGSGATFVLTGIIIPKGDLVRENFLWNEYENDGIKGALELTGVLFMVGSIPFFAASKKNNKRAMSFSFKTETAPQLVKSNFVYRPVPALAFKIAL